MRSTQTFVAERSPPAGGPAAAREPRPSGSSSSPTAAAAAAVVGGGDHAGSGTSWGHSPPHLTPTSAHASAAAAAAAQTAATTAAVGVDTGGPRSEEWSLNVAALRMDQVTMALIASVQMLIVATQWSKAASMRGRVHTLMVLAMESGTLCVMTGWPQLYLANRAWLLPLLLFATCLVPSVRSIEAGSALILERLPQPGLLGALLDLARVAMGTRILHIGIVAITMMQPPAGSLLTQAGLVYLTGNGDGYCSTQLLRHPLTQRRIADAAMALEVASLPLTLMQPTSWHLLYSANVMEGRAQREVVCRATLSFLQISFALVLPTLLSAYCWRQPPPPASAQAADTAPPAGGRLDAPRAQPRPLPPGFLARVRDGGGRAGLAANRALHVFLNAELLVFGRGVLYWWLLTLLWMLCKLSAGL